MSEITKEMIFSPSKPYFESAQVFGVLSPFEPGTRTLEKGFKLLPDAMALEEELIFEKDVALQLRDGKTLYTDIFRPVTDEKVPAIISWSSYGKSSFTSPRYMNIYRGVGLSPAATSGLQKWEGPDPAWWCPKGYAIINPDARGIAHSPGKTTMIGTQEAEDAYDLIEWLAEQPWCNGKVALSGCSYLAFSQWFIAAEQPPHLTCINPHEGLSDAYRDFAFRGGIEDKGFVEVLEGAHCGIAGNMREDWQAEMDAFPLITHPVWADKVARCQDIKVPAYIVASYSNTLHTNGTFRAWREIASEEKWLRIHNTQEWPDYYDEWSTEDRRRFFDHYLRGIDNGWENTPRVRYSLLDMEDGDVVNIPDTQFPPADVRYVNLYPKAMGRVLIPAKSEQDIPLKYLVDGVSDKIGVAENMMVGSGQLSFTHTFQQKTEVIGYPSVHLEVEVQDADDAELYVVMQKLDAHGNTCDEFCIPNKTCFMRDFTDHSDSIVRYNGPSGRIKVSMSALDEEKSTEDIPVQAYDRIQKMEPGQIVPVDIALMPAGLVFYPGESLRLLISPKNIAQNILGWVPAHKDENTGMHIIHTGGKYASYLRIPMRVAE